MEQAPQFLTSLQFFAKFQWHQSEHLSPQAAILAAGFGIATASVAASVAELLGVAASVAELLVGREDAGGGGDGDGGERWRAAEEANGLDLVAETAAGRAEAHC